VRSLLTGKGFSKSSGTSALYAKTGSDQRKQHWIMIIRLGIYGLYCIGTVTALKAV
jgi:hypothetical protein